MVTRTRPIVTRIIRTLPLYIFTVGSRIHVCQGFSVLPFIDYCRGCISAVNLCIYNYVVRCCLCIVVVIVISTITSTASPVIKYITNCVCH
jgi:hypothetical protein